MKTKKKDSQRKWWNWYWIVGDDDYPSSDSDKSSNWDNKSNLADISINYSFQKPSRKVIKK